MRHRALAEEGAPGHAGSELEGAHVVEADELGLGHRPIIAREVR